MYRILDATSATERICGRQSYDPDVQYRLTTLCVQAPCTDGTLWFHTLTGALLLLKPHETIHGNEQELVENRFLVPEAFDDKKYALEVRRILSLLHPRFHYQTAFTILTTTDCNARCSYCYELNSKRMTMSEAVARDTADYIARVCGGKNVSITWFGGEPLYNAQAIDVIAARLDALGVSFSTRIISNAYLFDEDTVRRAVSDWRLKSAQITIDGTKERYQRTKAYIYADENAYERVLHNIDRLLRAGVKVSVRLNMNRDNADDLNRLSDELAERFRGRKGFSAYPILLKEFVGKVGAFDSDEEAVQRLLSLRQKLRADGLLHTAPLVRKIAFQRCMADNDACEVIMPDGAIGKCEHFSESEIIGTIYSDERDTALRDSWKEQVFDTHCQRCPLIPRCIELKKCAWSKQGCSERTRRLRMEKLKEQILAAYLSEKHQMG